MNAQPGIVLQAWLPTAAARMQRRQLLHVIRRKRNADETRLAQLQDKLAEVQSASPDDNIAHIYTFRNTVLSEWNIGLAERTKGRSEKRKWISLVRRGMSHICLQDSYQERLLSTAVAITGFVVTYLTMFTKCGDEWRIKLDTWSVNVIEDASPEPDVED